VGAHTSKILIVEDDQYIRMLFAEELIEEGYDVITCEDGARLGDLIEQENPQLIVMGIRWDLKKGFDFLKDGKNTYGNVPVILCNSDRARRYDLESIGGVFHVITNSNVQKVKYQIKRVLGGEIMPQAAASGCEFCKAKTMCKEQMRLPFCDRYWG